jgi:hypothetical protein
VIQKEIGLMHVTTYASTLFIVPTNIICGYIMSANHHHMFSVICSRFNQLFIFYALLMVLPTSYIVLLIIIMVLSLDVHSSTNFVQGFVYCS